ncbi:site-specific integrase [Streptomyces sp. RLA2-12]|nr:site-specific integrase [Streptomyces sp. RLA2-12]QDN57331.1 site-specific integrase [Streptomyces sp. S1D4-20]QDN67505.1 site-specific integrase [Streptomyces sp. S1D4-14]QDO49915.1 site-specific integrase [Streptomyces sp. RLB3-5]QDO60155.1 site-specific integrase [Streptomyces sp. RLB1-8]
MPSWLRRCEPLPSKASRSRIAKTSAMRSLTSSGVSQATAVDSTGLGDVHFHDLRHTGNTLAATGGATTRELMHRMGHSSVRAALIYQHLVNGRDLQIADYVDGQIRKVKRPRRGPSGT